MSLIRRLIIKFKFRKMTRNFDRAIANARRRHMPVNHIRQAKSDFVHDVLRRELGR